MRGQHSCNYNAPKVGQNIGPMQPIFWRSSDIYYMFRGISLVLRFANDLQGVYHLRLKNKFSSQFKPYHFLTEHR